MTAARTLFLEKGYEGTSTAQIAKEAGVSEGILFHHFGSKKNLFRDILSDYAQGAAAATMPQDLEQLTEEYVVRNAFAFSEANREIYDMLASGLGDLNEQDLELSGDIIVDVIESRLRAGMDQGDHTGIRQGNPRIMAQLQFAIVDSAYRAWRRTNDPELKEEYITEAVRCMQSMLAPVTRKAGNKKSKA